MHYRCPRGEQPRSIAFFEEHPALLRRCREIRHPTRLRREDAAAQTLAQAEAADLTLEQMNEALQAGSWMSPELIEILIELAAGGAQIRYCLRSSR